MIQIPRDRSLLLFLSAFVFLFVTGFALRTGLTLPGEAELCVSISDSMGLLLPLFKVISVYGGTILALFVSILLTVIRKTRMLGIACLLMTVLVWVSVDVVVKNIVCRDRPCVYLGIEPLVAIHSLYSFPSCHAAVTFAFVGFFIRYPRISVPVALYGVLMAVSRVAVYAHYPTDVVCGAVFGVIFGVAFCLLASGWSLGHGNDLTDSID